MPVTPPNQLFPPNRSGGKGVLDALAARKTTREIAQTPLPAQLLSDLLWAANGVNRDAGPFSGAGRTAASAGNSQEIELYLSTAAGSSLYEPSEHRLHKVEERDVRGLGLTPGQRSAEGWAPLQLILVADMAKLSHGARTREPGPHDSETQTAYAYFDGGLVAGNLWLFAAAYGLGIWVHNCDKDALSQALKLRPDQRILFVASIGYPLNP